MAKGYRQGRLGEEIKKVISDLLLRELKDPRLQSALVSVSAVSVTPDGSYATVYVSTLALSDEKEKKEAEKKEPAKAKKNETAKAEMTVGETGQQQEIIIALQNAKGFIRREIGKQMKLRHVPDLVFRMDTSLEYGRHIDQLIEDLGITEESKELGITEESKENET